MAKLDRTIKVLREAADLFDALPAPLKIGTIFGGTLVQPQHLRQQAGALEATRDALVAYELDPEEVPTDGA